MSLADALKKLKFDKRLIDNSLSKGHLKKEELEKFLKELPDVSNNIDIIDLEAEDSDMADKH